MDECQIVMGEERGAEIRALMESVLGTPCWCIRGPVACPILHPIQLQQTRLAS